MIMSKRRLLHALEEIHSETDTKLESEADNDDKKKESTTHKVLKTVTDVINTVVKGIQAGNNMEVCSEADETEDTLGDEMLELMEASNELDSKIVDIDNDFGVIDEIESSIERLEGIRDAIAKYGISRPMMEAVDPNSELVGIGICCSYEDLSNIPMMDVQADTTLEGVNDTINVSINNFKLFFQSSYVKLKELVAQEFLVSDDFKANSTSIGKRIELSNNRLKSIKCDEFVNTLNDMSVALEAETFDRIKAKFIIDKATDIINGKITQVVVEVTE